MSDPDAARSMCSSAVETPFSTSSAPLVSVVAWWFDGRRLSGARSRKGCETSSGRVPKYQSVSVAVGKSLLVLICTFGKTGARGRALVGNETGTGVPSSRDDSGVLLGWTSSA